MPAVLECLAMRGTLAPYRPDLPARVSELVVPDVGRKARFTVSTMGSAGCGSRTFAGRWLRALCTFVAVDIVASYLAVTLHVALDGPSLPPYVHPGSAACRCSAALGAPRCHTHGRITSGGRQTADAARRRPRSRNSAGPREHPERHQWRPVASSAAGAVLEDEATQGDEEAGKKASNLLRANPAP